jgi:Family of unknown function (DUF6464)
LGLFYSLIVNTYLPLLFGSATTETNLLLSHSIYGLVSITQDFSTFYLNYHSKRKVLETVLIFAIGLTPPLVSVWVMRQAQTRAREQLRLAMDRASFMPLIAPVLTPQTQYMPDVGDLVGDISCKFNARSGYLRCAINPAGPCEGCRHYQARDY